MINLVRDWIFKMSLHPNQTIKTFEKRKKKKCNRRWEVASKRRKLHLPTGERVVRMHGDGLNDTDRRTHYHGYFSRPVRRGYVEGRDMTSLHPHRCPSWSTSKRRTINISNSH